MATIDRTRTIAAPIEEIWDVLADFGAISTWVDNVEHSCILVSRAKPLGTARRVQVGRNTLVETIVEFDPPHTLAYEIEGLPKQMGELTNRWTLRREGEDTTVTLTSTVEIGSRPDQQLAERVICRMLAHQNASMLAGLAKRMERARV
ncbi:SRPBCC family protein [Mycolicibacterium pulveris]|uniref:SRPBCC family protein n=1 Tax=Mycolicibacterium pulveris TaxID=36813 RepID=UPI0013D37B30|nr:SRPBCC family protein [Mycolicibacterium pulveris]MCV6978682.1 SRPBCC family protein [Mycolicibacterium pulveris]